MSANQFSRCWIALGVWAHRPGWTVVDVYNPHLSCGVYSGKTEDELREEYGSSLRLVTSEQAEEIAFQQARVPIARVDEASFEEMLDELPPMAWHTERGWSSFAFREFDCGRVTAIFIKTEAGCFRLHDDIALARDIAKLRAIVEDFISYEAKEVNK